MPKDLMKMKRELSGKVGEMRAILTAQETRSDKALTSEESTKYDALKNEVQNRSAEIEREEHLQTLEAGTAVRSADEPNEIKDLGDFLAEVRFNPNSSALRSRDLSGAKGAREKRDVTMGNGISAGFLVPETVDRNIRMVAAPDAIFRPRAMVIPAGDPADAPFTLTALDQSGSLGVYSGVVTRWVGEVAARQDAGDPKIRQIKIEPQEVSGYIDISDKLLRNSAAAGSMVQQLLRAAIVGTEEDAFCSGDGVAKPLGYLGHPATLTQTRAVASQISYADVVGMFAKMKAGSNPVFIANQTCLPQLMTMASTLGQLVWQPSAREGVPSTLLGFPLLLNDQAPVLGTEGDLSLVDLKYYAIKDGSPLAIFMDPYSQKANGLTRIYAFWNVDGQPMLNTPLLQRDGSSQVSPFVALK